MPMTPSSRRGEAMGFLSRHIAMMYLPKEEGLK